MFCPKCQNRIERYMEYCNKCGRKLNDRDLGLLREELGMYDTPQEPHYEQINPACSNEEFDKDDNVPHIDVSEMFDSNAKQAEYVDVSGDISKPLTHDDTAEQNTGEGDFDFYLNRIKELEISNRSLKKKCEELQQSVSSPNENAALELRIQALSEENDELRVQNQTLSDKLDKSRKRIEKRNEKIKEMEELLDNYESIISAVRNAVGISDASIMDHEYISEDSMDNSIYDYDEANRFVEQQDEQTHYQDPQNVSEGYENLQDEQQIVQNIAFGNRYICPSCNQEIRAGINFCTKCGHDLRRS